MRGVLFLVLILQCAVHTGHSAFAQSGNPRSIDPGPSIQTVVTLQQNWSDAEANWFYNIPQGSRLLPYDWFLYLERAGSVEKFRSSRNIRRHGFIPRYSDSRGNPDALPIGFVPDASYEDGTRSLGLTCAACHTTQINYGTTALIVDGGPTMGDFAALMTGLAAALRATADNDRKFLRFADAVLPQGAADNDRQELRKAVRQMAGIREGYNQRNLPQPGQVPFGPGRVDAFGTIFNEVAVTFLDRPGNHRPANAPVSYPCLWDTPHQDKLQWTGAAENKVNPVGTLLVGTQHIGALGRNAGQVLGVFGTVDISRGEQQLPQRYESTVNTKNLIQIQQTLTNLWSPKWPEHILGEINSDDAAAGKLLFENHCACCHDSAFQRDQESRLVEAHLEQVGTDRTMLQNLGHVARTGVLKGRRKALLSSERFGDRASISEILRHIVQRVVLRPELDLQQKGSDLSSIPVPAGRTNLQMVNSGAHRTHRATLGTQQSPDEFTGVAGQEGLHLRSAESGGSIPAAVERSADNQELPATTGAPRLADKDKLTALGYKARPLNGVWATAPYLHNGSVPSLTELLKPAEQRCATFHIGGLDFDCINVGYVQQTDQPVFDTRRQGNRNTGHEFGTNLGPVEKRQLIEFLKSL